MNNDFNTNLNNDNKTVDSNERPTVTTLQVFVESYLCYQLLKDMGYDLSSGYYAAKGGLPYRYQARLFPIERNINHRFQRVGYYSGLTQLRRSVRRKMPKLSPRMRIFLNLGILGFITYHLWQEKKQFKNAQNNPYAFAFNELNQNVADDDNDKAKKLSS